MKSPNSPKHPASFSDASSPSVYLAGPEVFYPDARARGQAICALCTEQGFEGLYPLDAPIDPYIQPKSRAIFEANKALIDRADAVLANLRDWRGHEPDSGTVWEVAYALAMGKPVIAYLPNAQTLRERMSELAPGGVDPDGNEVEDFDLPLNLMLAHSLTGVAYGQEGQHQGLKAALVLLRRHLGMTNTT
jgi:nucleoside 2-deoxyribosyltransferase